jgi:hypothetical protein
MAEPFVTFSLETDAESSPWFQRLGRGTTRMAVKGTWAGSVTLNRRGPDNVVYLVRDLTGETASFTANTGLFETDDSGPYRFTFTRVSGTAEMVAWSDESLINTPFNFPLMDGSALLTEGGEYLEMENA